MIPGVFQLEFVTGNDVTFRYDLAASDAVTPIDLTGCRVDLTVRDAANAVVLTVSSVTVGEITAPTSAGSIVGTIPRAKSAIPPTSDASGGPRYSWDLQVTSASGAVVTYLVGTCRVGKRVSA